jgi:hypothetical protein
MSSCESSLEERAGHVIFRYLSFVEHDRAKEHLLTLPVLRVFETRDSGRQEILTVLNVCFRYEGVILVMAKQVVLRVCSMRAFLAFFFERRTTKE